MVGYRESGTHRVFLPTTNGDASMTPTVLVALELDVDTDYAVSDDVWTRALAALGHAATEMNS
ncbi:hypothetical protein ASG12_07560 [Williamsia sp. Leaf354]|nr:hypothetical protein ASG12_07560 [Williamsia sp. Leaf354]